MSAEELSFDDDEPISLEGDDDEKLLQAPEAEKEEDLGTISLIDDDEDSEIRSGGVKAFGAGAKSASAHKSDFDRDLNVTGKGATRCRIFHSKLAAPSLEFMENQINEWIDADGTIDVKQVGHVVGQMTGKTTEPALIVTVWY